MEIAAGQLRGRSSLRGHHVAAATIGNALEFYDFLTYAFFSIQIGHAFFPAQSAFGSLMLSLATFGAGFVTRPIGAFVIGNYLISAVVSGPFRQSGWPTRDESRKCQPECRSGPSIVAGHITRTALVVGRP